MQSNKQLESIHRVLSPFSVRTTLSPLLEPTLDTGFIWGESPTRLLKPIHPCILPRPEEMVLRGVEIPAPPRASPEILENTDLEAPPWESSLWQAEKRGLVCLEAENLGIRLEGCWWTRVGEVAICRARLAG